MPRIGAAEAEFAGSIPNRAGAAPSPPEWPPCSGRAARKMRARRGQTATSSGLDFSKVLINNDLDRLGRYAVAAGHLLGSKLEPGTRDEPASRSLVRAHQYSTINALRRGRHWSRKRGLVRRINVQRSMARAGSRGRSTGAPVDGAGINRGFVGVEVFEVQ